MSGPYSPEITECDHQQSGAGEFEGVFSDEYGREHNFYGLTEVVFDKQDEPSLVVVACKFESTELDATPEFRALVAEYLTDGFDFVAEVLSKLENEMESRFENWKNNF